MVSNEIIEDVNLCAFYTTVVSAEPLMGETSTVLAVETGDEALMKR